MPPSHRYFSFDGTGETYYADGSVERRWHADKDLRLHDLNRTVFRHSGPVKNWDPKFSVECWSKGPVEDMPWVGFSSRPIVSDKMRVWLEEHAAGHAQYLPVTLKVRKKTLKLPPYWITNWLHEIECHDPTTTEWTENKEGQRAIIVLTIDSQKVPKDIKIFKAKHSVGEILIRDDLKSLLEASGLKGPHYSNVRHTGDPWPPPDEEENTFPDLPPHPRLRGR